MEYTFDLLGGVSREHPSISSIFRTSLFTPGASLTYHHLHLFRKNLSTILLPEVNTNKECPFHIPSQIQGWNPNQT